MKLVEGLIDACHKVYNRGFVSAYDGNLSARIDEKTFLITRSGVNKGEVKTEDILTIDSSGELISGSGKITTEVKLHLKIYNSRHEINSVIHCHPIYSNAIAITHEKFPNTLFPEAILTLGEIPICEYATPSTEELANTLNPFLEFANVFLLSNHGAVSIGSSIEEAYFRMEKLEQLSKTIVSAKSLGEIKQLSENKINELYSIAKNTYGIIVDKRNMVLRNGK